jgi:hypothetical protein
VPAAEGTLPGTRIDPDQGTVTRRTAGSASPVLENTMFGFVGAHFEALVLIGFGAFTACLGYVSIADAFARRP